jgi:transcription antitermination factor NusG
LAVKPHMSGASIKKLSAAFSEKWAEASPDFSENVRRLLSLFRERGIKHFYADEVASVLRALGLLSDREEGFRYSDLIEKEIRSACTPLEGSLWKVLENDPFPQEGRGGRRDKKDERDMRTWAVFELSPLGEASAEKGEIDAYLIDLFGRRLEIFVPYAIYQQEGRREVFSVMEGYVFVEHCLDDREYLHVVHENPYLKKVLHSKIAGNLALHTVPERSIQELKDRLAKEVAVEIQEGMQVEVVRGLFRGLSGVVLKVEEEEAFVRFSMRSLHTVRTVKRYFLMPCGGSDEQLLGRTRPS